VIVAATEGAYQKAYEIVERFGPDALLVFVVERRRGQLVSDRRP